MKSRIFNKILIDKENKCFFKSSTDVNKLKDEVNYYKSIPQEILNYFPCLLNYKSDYSEYVLEYIPYKNLSELLLNKEINKIEGFDILKKLIFILNEIHQTTYPEDTRIDLSQFYINKTFKRLNRLKENSFFMAIMDEDYIEINNKQYKNFNILREPFISAINHYVTPQSSISMIHGDFCFSNILYCKETKTVKLIDPRGSFGEKGIYGHSYYDYAKILHCLHGNYDYFANDNFHLKELDKNRFTLKVNKENLINELYHYYLQLLHEQKIDIALLMIIEASLFLSMAVLHYENFERQKALFFTGIIILNNFFEGNYENLH